VRDLICLAAESYLALYHFLPYYYCY